MVIFGCLALRPPVAYAAQTADGFVYEVGDFLFDGVHSGDIDQYFKDYAAKEQEEHGEDCTYTIEWHRDEYGLGFSASSSITGGGGIAGGGMGIQGWDCGYGAYITDYVGDADSVVVPNQIEGKPVVFFDYWNVALLERNEAYNGIKRIDFSNCESLKAATAVGPTEVRFGAKNAGKLVQVKVGSVHDEIQSLDLLPATNLEVLEFLGSAPRKCALPLKELRSLSVREGTGLSSLNVAGAARLEEIVSGEGGLVDANLNLSGCTSLKRVVLPYNGLTAFDPNQFPRLEELDLAGNYIHDVSALVLWGKQPGHECSYEGQRRPDKSFGADKVKIAQAEYVADGKPKEPKVTVDGLVEGKDFRVYYRDNIRKGTATVFATGINDYYGCTVIKQFVIKDAPAGSASSKPVPSGKPSAPAVAKVSLAQAEVTVADRAWTGKKLAPKKVTVKLGGRTLRQGVDYAVSCKGGKKVGSYKVTVTGKGAYTGAKAGTFKIVPKGTSVKKLAKARRGFTATWKKPSKAALKQTTGYQVRYSLKKSMKGAKAKTVKASSKGGEKCQLKVSKLKGGKKYYVQVRTYKKVGKATYYSSWSKAKAVKTGK